MEHVRFLRPWSVHPHPEAFEVRSANGLPVVFVHFEVTELIGTRRYRHSRANAWRIARQISRLPDLLELHRRAHN